MGKRISGIILFAAAVVLQLALAAPCGAQNANNMTPEEQKARQPSMVNGQPLWLPPEMLVDVNENGFPTLKTQRFIFNILQVFKGDEKEGELATGALVFLPRLVTHKIDGNSARYTAAAGADGTGKMADIVGSDLGDTLNVKLAALPAFMQVPLLEKVGQFSFTFTTGYGDDIVNLALNNDRAAMTLIHTGGQDTVTVSGIMNKTQLVIRGTSFDAIIPQDIAQDAGQHVQRVRFVMEKGTIILQGENLDGFTVRAETGGAFKISTAGVTRDATVPAMDLSGEPPGATDTPIPSTPVPAAPQPRLLRDDQTPSQEKGSPIVWKIKAAYDVNRLGAELTEQIRRLIANPEKSPQTLESVLTALEAKMGRRLYFHPPADLGIAALQAAPDPACPPGKAVLDKAGQYTPEIPAGCKRVLVKAWGAGGGGARGSMSLIINGMKQPNTGSGGGSHGGFSAGLIELNGGQLAVTVGGGGADSTGVEGGKGGYNGGGAGGRGSRRPPRVGGMDAFEQMGGGGGGGATTAGVNGETLLVAGGGGGGGAQSGGFAGGGASAAKYLQDYSRWIGNANPSFSIGIGQPGDAGSGGAAGEAFKSNGGADRAAQILACFDLPQDGRALEGGNGGGSKELSCGDIGGGGGGAGFGGGGGGHFGDRGAAGGGGGLAPRDGVTLWGGIAAPANAKDPDYKQPHGLSAQDGLIVVSWPAPEPAAFMSAVKNALFVEKKND